MTPRIAVDSYDFIVRADRISLVHAEYLDKGEPAEAVQAYNDDPSVLVGISLRRYTPLALSAALIVEAPPEAPMAVSVTYVAHYVMSGEVPEEKRESEWKHVAYYLAPALLYPYAREMISNLSSRAFGGPLTLPFVPIPLDFDDEEMLIPPPESDETNYQEEIGFPKPTSWSGDADQRAEAK